GGELFTVSALRLIWEHSHGVPRQINKLCFNALLLATAAGQMSIDADILLEVTKDFDLDRVQFNPQPTESDGKLVQSGNTPRVINEAPEQRRQNVEALPGALSVDHIKRSRAELGSQTNEKEIGEPVVPDARTELS